MSYIYDTTAARNPRVGMPNEIVHIVVTICSKLCKLHQFKTFYVSKYYKYRHKCLCYVGYMFAGPVDILL